MRVTFQVISHIDNSCCHQCSNSQWYRRIKYIWL